MRHLFRDGAGEISVAFAGGKTFGANLVAIDRQWDLAALEIAPPAAPPVDIATDAPRPGDWLESCGFGPDGRWRCNRGQARGYVQAAGTTGPETLELGGSARQGDSGGPVFNDRGQLAAVLWGTDGGDGRRHVLRPSPRVSCQAAPSQSTGKPRTSRDANASRGPNAVPNEERDASGTSAGWSG